MPERPDRRPALSRADLPAEITAASIRDLPISTLRRLADHRNGVLNADEQRAFDKVVRQVMAESAQRVSRQLSDAQWSRVRRDEAAHASHTGRRPARADQQLARIADRINAQVGLAEKLAPGVDWSFAQPKSPAPAVTSPPATEGDGDAIGSADADADNDQSGTVSDLEQRISDQVELVDVMTEIAEVSKRTYDLEQQRDLQNTRTVFFGLVVSIAVLVAGWAPLVEADGWADRFWMIGLTLATCVLAALVYGLVRLQQKRRATSEADAAQSPPPEQKENS